MERVSHSPGPPRLLSSDRVRELLVAANPVYGGHFADADWERITERVEALARLLWRISRRTALTSSAERAGSEPRRRSAAGNDVVGRDDHRAIG